jgi:tRNA(fMet)-specific endonuclease VapC
MRRGIVEVKPILLDTNVYAAFKNGDSEAVDIIQRSPVIVVNTIVLGELIGGFATGAREGMNRQALAEFLASTRVFVLSLDQGTAEHYAAVCSALKKKGSPIPTNDMWIAANAIQHDLTLFSYDRHFRVVPKLRICSSLADLESM